MAQRRACCKMTLAHPVLLRAPWVVPKSTVCAGAQYLDAFTKLYVSSLPTCLINSTTLDSAWPILSIMALVAFGFHFPAIWLTAILGLVLLFVYDIFATRKLLSRLPYPLVGAGSRLTPAFLLNWRFATNAASLLETGYHKYRDSPFQLLVNGEPTVIIPPRLLDELASLSPGIASTAAALEHDFMGAWTGHFQMLLESRLHFSIIQRKLTPKLGQLAPELRRELAIALDEFLPVGKDWKKINAHHLMTRLALRMSGYILIGPELCRDPRWTKLVVKWTENSGITFAILRFLPAFMRPIAVRMLPSHWISVYYERQAQQLLEPHLMELLRATEENRPGSDVEKAEAMMKDDNALSWLAGIARGKYRDPAAMTQIILILVFASVHSVMVRLVDTFFDIMDHPELLEELRAEAAEAAQTTAAKDGAEQTATTKVSAPLSSQQPQEAERSDPPAVSGYSALLQPKMDSAMRESQRLHPVLMVGMKRIFQQPHTFKDGTHILAGTHVCMPSLAAATDPAIFPDPLRFDGLRSYKQRLLEQANATSSGLDDKFAFAYANDPYEMGFGYGRMACPGRYFSGMTIQMILTRLLVEYEVGYVPGKGRPGDVQMHDFFVPWPLGKVMMRRR